MKMKHDPFVNKAIAYKLPCFTSSPCCCFFVIFYFSFIISTNTTLPIQCYFYVWMIDLSMFSSAYWFYRYKQRVVNKKWRVCHVWDVHILHTRRMNNSCYVGVGWLLCESSQSTSSKCMHTQGSKKNIKFSRNINHILAILYVYFGIVLSQFKFTASIYNVWLSTAQ